jgi:hypothetical protein
MIAAPTLPDAPIVGEWGSLRTIAQQQSESNAGGGIKSNLLRKEKQKA